MIKHLSNFFVALINQNRAHYCMINSTKSFKNPLALDFCYYCNYEKNILLGSETTVFIIYSAV